MAAVVRRKRRMVGVVVSDKMDKTVVVRVARRVPHTRYDKYVTRRSKFKAHDETNKCRPGDQVEITECRPLSKDKRWRVSRVVRKAVVVEAEG